MTTADLLSEAVDELYTADPDAFTERRAALAAQARAAGDTAAARSIAKLRKPTRSAWAINQVIRADPSATDRLAGLGDQLRDAERSMDGTKIRELSLARRQLIDALVADTLAVSGQQPPPAALREEVTATFGAALADRRFAEQLAAGVLLRAERRAGFGSGAAPDLLLVKPPDGTAPAPAAKAGTAAAQPRQARQAAPPAAKPSPARSPAAPGKARTVAAERRRAAKTRAQAVAEKEQERAAARARAERERQQVIAEAERAVTEAGQALTEATAAEREQESAVQRMEEQLAEARLRLSALRLQARRAKAEQRKTRDRLDQLRR